MGEWEGDGGDVREVEAALFCSLFFSSVVEVDLMACSEAGPRLSWGIVVCGMKLCIYVDDTMVT